MKAMLFAAGLGTRLKPLTDTRPKALVAIGGKTLLQWQIERLKAAGIQDIVVNVHHFPDQIIGYLAAHGNFGCRIRISDERDRLLDTGGGLRKAQDLLLQGNSEEPILACNVDILSNINIATLCRAYRPDDLGLLVVSPRTTQRYLLWDDEMRLRGWINRATGERRPDTLTAEAVQGLLPLAFSGMQVLHPRVFDAMHRVLQEKGEVFSLIDLYLSVADEERLRGYVPSDYRMMDVGKINQLTEAEAFVQTL